MVVDIEAVLGVWARGLYMEATDVGDVRTCMHALRIWVGCPAHRTPPCACGVWSTFSIVIILALGLLPSSMSMFFLRDI
jgi:hypothetical protein